MLWPGVMSPDASSQYSAAISGLYSDHHPPLMSFLWRYFDHIYQGPATMFIFHISMLYAAAAIFIHIFKESRFKWWYAIYPVLPNILAYTALIVKDTGFTFTYLLSAAILSFLIVNNVQKFRTLILLPLIMLLFYGTAVKFQAKFLLIFFTLGISYCACNYKFNAKSILGGITLYLAIMFGIMAVNSHLVPSAREAHSWQWVKVYDLSAISLALNKPLYPEFILQQQNFDFAKVRELFEPREVDPLVFPHDAVIRSGVDAHQRQALWDYWFKTITNHPFVYLKARFNLFTYDLITAPCDRNNPVKFLQNTAALAPILGIPGIAVAVDAGYTIFKIILRFIWLVPILFIYASLAISNFNKHRASAPLLIFTCSSFALLIILFFFSMAGTARYVFFCTCLMHAAHGFAYNLIMEKATLTTNALQTA